MQLGNINDILLKSSFYMSNIRDLCQLWNVSSINE